MYRRYISYYFIITLSCVFFMNMHENNYVYYYFYLFIYLLSEFYLPLLNKKTSALIQYKGVYV